MRWHPLGLILILFLSACVPTVEPHRAVYLSLAGSTSMRPLMEDLAQAYRTGHEYAQIDIDGRGSQLGLEALQDGKVDVALVGREISTQELADLEATQMAWDGIAIVVNEANPLNGLTTGELRAVFSGERLGWEEVGAIAGRIQVVSREEGSGTRDSFEALVMSGRRVTSAAVVMPSSQAVVEYVAQNPQAIGYVSMGIGLKGTKVLRIDGVVPGPETVSREYPLSRPFLLVTAKQPGKEIEAFIDFCLSPAAQAMVGEHYGRVR